MREQGTVLLADRIRSGEIHYPYPDAPQSDGGFMASLINESVIIDATEVYRYYWSPSTAEKWNLTKDFPCVTPPFESMFIEARVADFPLLNPKGPMFKRQGALIKSIKIKGHSLEALANAEFPNSHQFPAIALMSSTGKMLRESGELDIQHESEYWLIILMGCEEFHNGKMVSSGSMCVITDSDGTPLSDSISCVSALFSGKKTSDIDQSRKSDVLDYVSHLTFPALLAISFMHCKNIKLNPKEPVPALSKSFQKRCGKPLLRYHVLEIDPMKKVLESEGGISKNGFKKALHICRGHFANYTADKPLFGHITGRFWKPAHVRGAKEFGTVLKDYSVKAPVDGR